MRNFYVGQKHVGHCIGPGIKVWSNGIPLKADTYKSCSNRCSYCFARALSAYWVERAGVRYNPRLARTMDMAAMARYFQRAQEEPDGWILWALRNRYFIELGTMGEVFQDEDLDMRVTWNFLQLCRAYRIPLFINTKANLLIRDESYFRLLVTHTAPVIISLTLIGVDDQLCKRYEGGRVPSATERLDLIRRLWEHNIPVTVYCGPYLEGVTNAGGTARPFIEAVIEAGAINVHLRNLYLTGKLMSRPFWRRYTLLMGRVPLHQEVNPINAEVWLAWELGVEIGQPYTSQDFAEYLLSLPWVVVNHRGLKSIALRAFAWFWEGREWYRRNTNMHVGCGLREWHSTLLDSPLNTRGSKAVSAIYHQVRDYVAKGN